MTKYPKGLSICRALETCLQCAFLMGGFAFITGCVFLLENAWLCALGVGLMNLTRQVLKMGNNIAGRVPVSVLCSRLGKLQRHALNYWEQKSRSELAKKVLISHQY